MESNLFALPAKTRVVAEPSALPNNNPMRWESWGLMIDVHKSLNTTLPPTSIDLASTLGAASDLPLAVKKSSRFWFDPAIKTKVDVVRYVNAICRQNGFKISTLSNSKQGLDRRAQLVCSRGIVARKPRGKSESVQTTTTRPITPEKKCPFSITVYECRESGRWYLRKYGNGSRMHCGHCQLRPEQVGIREFQNLTGRNGDNWSDEHATANSKNDPKTGLGTKTGDQSAKGTQDKNKNANDVLIPQAEQGVSGLGISSDNVVAQDIDRDQLLRQINGIHDRISHLNSSNNYEDQLLHQQAELRRFQGIEGRLDGVDWRANNILRQNQCLALYDDLRALNNQDDRLFLERQLGMFPMSTIGLLGSLARRNEYINVRTYLSDCISISNDASFLLEQLEIRRRIARVTERYAIGWNGQNASDGTPNGTTAENEKRGERGSSGISTFNDDPRSLKTVTKEKPIDSKFPSSFADRADKKTETNNHADHLHSRIPTETAGKSSSSENNLIDCDDPCNQISDKVAVLPKKSELEKVESGSLDVRGNSGKKNIDTRNSAVTLAVDRDSYSVADRDNSGATDRHGSSGCIVGATKCKKQPVDDSCVENSDSNNFTVGETNATTDEIYEDDYAMLRPMVIYDYPSNQNLEHPASGQDCLSSTEHNNDIDGDGTKLKHGLKNDHLESSRSSYKRQKTI